MASNVSISVSVSEQERRVLETLSEAWNLFIEINPVLAEEVDRFSYAIDSAALVVAGLVARRVDPKLWRQPGE